MAKTLSAVLAFAGASTSLAYKAAFVEYEWVSPCGQSSCGAETKAASVKAFATHAATAASQGAQIVVFPEYGITGESSYPKSSWQSGGYTEVVPEPGQVPCGSANSEAPSIVSLSCTAKQNKIAIVANLIDYQSGKMYNTDVAFDTDGKLLAKYHKQNLWGESNIDVPAKCAEVTYTTSFGVTFGMFTCADLIFEHPAVDLATKGIKNFAIPVAWTTEESSLQVMPYAQGWSAAYGTNIIVANMRSASGSGIWSSGQAVTYFYSPDGSGTKVGVAEVPDQTSHPLSSHVAANAVRFDLSRVAFPPTTSWKFAELSSGAQLCSSTVCCTATVSAGAASGYVLAALDGNDGESGVASFPAQVCAVLPCSTASSSCLTHQAPSGNLKGVKVEMTGVTAASVVPEAFAGDETMLAPGSSTEGFVFSHSGTTASLTASTASKIGSVLLYGRTFDKDSLPYSCTPTLALV